MTGAGGVAGKKKLKGKVGPPAPTGPTAHITPASKVVVVPKSYTSPARQPVTLSADPGFKGSAVFESSGAAIKFFTLAAGGVEVTPANGNNVFTDAQLTAPGGVKVFAEGQSASTKIGDVELTLFPNPPIPLVGLPPVKEKMTAIELTLDISMSRTADAVDPAALPQPPDPPPAPGAGTDKWFGGRFVHVQDPGNQHGRALVVVHTRPAVDFGLTLVLRNVAVVGNIVTVVDNKVQLFIPEFGGTAQPSPLEFPAKDADGRRFWVEGSNISAALRDTGIQLGIKDLEPDADRVRLTVVRLSNLQALIPSTPPAQARMANGPVPNSRFRTATGAAPATAEFSLDFAVNRPLVLIHGAQPAGSLIQLSVTVAPAGVPVSWIAVRDTRPAPNGDSPAVVALSPSPIPTVVRNAVNLLLATLQDNAVGSFHIHPYIDCNNDNTFNTTRNKEPFLTMNLVLIRVGGSIGATNSTNTSVPHPGNIAPVPAIGTASSATGVRFSSGNFAGPATAGVQNVATIVVVGGGRNGRLGLDNLFGGWVNNLTGMNIQATYRDLGPGVDHFRNALAVSNLPNPGIFVPPGTPGAPPGSTAAPVNVPLPVLDTTNFGNEGTGGNTAVGTEGAIGPPTGIARNNLAVGQTFRIEMWDSPGFGAPAAQGLHPGRLTSFQYEVDFQCDMCFWTNSLVPGVPGPTPGPITGAVPPVPDAACTSYATVQTNRWAIRFRMNFAIPGGVPPLPPTIGTVPTSTITMAKDATPLRLARPAQGVLEVRFPIILRIVATNLLV